MHSSALVTYLLTAVSEAAFLGQRQIQEASHLAAGEPGLARHLEAFEVSADADQGNENAGPVAATADGKPGARWLSQGVGHTHTFLVIDIFCQP